MLTIRFSRVGRKNKAQFRIVLQQHTMTPTGKHIEVLGSYDPHQKKAVLKADKIKEWIGKGAQVSDSVYNLCVKEGLIEGKKRAVKMERPKPATVEEASVEAEKVEEKVEEVAVSEEKVEEKKAEVETPAAA
ncbi:MAG: 30S ribosomal protein S16 [Candidatus Moranbacteria bacterium]|nr:30S ribosomal protein S16 [Candidatus Moranbacteria bacterium]